jgi:hypothetical protein
MYNTCKSNNVFFAAHHSFWLAGNDLQVEGQWVWQPTQVSMDYDDWHRGEPNDAGHGQHCLSVSHKNDFKWSDDSCAQAHYYVCERPTAKVAISTQSYHSLHSLSSLSAAQKVVPRYI